MLSRDLRLISFDLDDTLWACTPVIQRAEQILYDWLKRNYPQITARYSQMHMREIRMEFVERQPALRHDLTRLRLESLRWHARQARYPEDLAEAAFEVFIEARNQVTLYDDVEPVLRRLSRNYRLVALTNGNANVRRMPIGRYFEVALSAADVGISKPAPDMFHRVLAEVGAEPAHMLHVGDDPLSDIQGAHNAGVASIWINREGRRWADEVARARHEIRDLHELLKLLEAE